MVYEDYKLIVDFWRWYKSLVHPDSTHTADAWDELMEAAGEFCRTHPGEFAADLINAALLEIDRRARRREQ